MKVTHLMAVQLAALLGLAGTVGADDDALSAALRGVVEESQGAYEAENADGVMRTIHTGSPEYDSTKAAIQEQFREQDLTLQLVDFRYMGHDDEFAIARVKTKIRGPSGSAFQNNEVDSVMLFHREGALWKLWSDHVLGVEFEEKVGTVTPVNPPPR